MALRGTLTHRKTRRLAAALQIPPCYALGVVEALWHVTAEQTPDGAIGKLTDQDIADEIFYDGDPAELIEALVATRWLDRCATHRLVVHGWADHADQATRRKLARNQREMAIADELSTAETPAVTSHVQSRLVMTSPPESRVQSPESSSREEETSVGVPPTPPTPDVTSDATDPPTVASSPQSSAPAPPDPTPPDPAPPPRQKRAARVRIRPAEESLTQERIDIALSIGLSPDEVAIEWAKLGDHEFRDPKSDWTRTWRTWCRNAIDFRRRDSRASPTRPTTTRHVAALGAALDRARPAGAPPLVFTDRTGPPPLAPPLRIAGGTT